VSVSQVYDSLFSWKALENPLEPIARLLISHMRHPAPQLRRTRIVGEIIPER
jgi:hypothetical protein